MNKKSSAVSIRAKLASSAYQLSAKNQSEDRRQKTESSFLKIGEAAKRLGVSIDTLRRWEREGKITTIRTPGGTRLYSTQTLEKIVPKKAPAPNPTPSQSPKSTENLLKKVDEAEFGINSKPLEIILRQESAKFKKKFKPPNINRPPAHDVAPPAEPESPATLPQRALNGSLTSLFLAFSLSIIITGLVLIGYLNNPAATKKFFAATGTSQEPSEKESGSVLAKALSPFNTLAVKTISFTNSELAESLGIKESSAISYQLSDNLRLESEDRRLMTESSVLASTTSATLLQINADTLIEGTINNLTLTATPSAGFTIAGGSASLNVSNISAIDQNVSTTASPTFVALTLTSAQNQITLASGQTITLPAATTTLVGTDTTQTLTNKSLSGSSNTFTNIPNSALTNSKVTVSAGTNLSGGGDVTLGSSVTLSLKDSPAISGVLSLANGTAAAPSLTFTDDTNTGLYRVSADTIGFVTGGTERMRLDSSGNLLPVATTTYSLGSTSLRWLKVWSQDIETTGNLEIDGNTTLGDASSDTVTLNGRVNTSVVPSSDNSYDLGTTSLRWRSFYLGTTAAISGNVGVGVSFAQATLPANGLAVQGNVGIGTTSPTSNLHVIGTGNFTSNLTVGGTLGVTGVTTLSANNGALSFTGTTPSITSGSSLFGIFAGGNVGIGTTATLGSSFNVNGNQVIGSTFIGGAAPANGLAVSGNVGIGTSTTSQALHVIGSGQFTGTILNADGSASAPAYSFSSDTDTGLWRIGSNQIALTTAGGAMSGLSINSSGNVGIGNTSASQLFQINATGSTPFVVTSSGNVGVANSAPSFALDVIGSTRISSNAVLGDASSDTVTFNAVVNSNILADSSNSRDFGSSSVRWANGYFTTLDATNLSGTVTGGSTTSSSWTVNSDNATANAEISSLAFETGTAAFNAVMQWNASGDAGRQTGYDDNFLFNYPISLFSQVSGGNQTFTSGSLVNFGQSATHAITQSGAFIGADFDFSSNITVPNSASGNQTGVLITLKDGGASATSKGFETAGTSDFGLYFSGETQSYFSGNVGLGTTAPRQKLQVNADGTSSFVVTSGGNVGIGFTTPTASLQISSTASQDLFRIEDNGPGDTSPFVINLDGNVGIANSAPSYTLDVVGTGRISGNVGIGTSGVAGAALQVNGGGLFGWGTATTALSSGAIAGFNGNVGIGTTTPNSKLTVVGNAMISQTWSGLTVPTSGLFVEGNVGIGATTSSNKLDVWGNTRLAGTLTVDSNSTVGGTLGVTGVTTLSANNGALSFTGTTPSITSGSSLFGIFAGGNVGIGTTGNVYGGLTVRGAGTGTGITFQTYGSGLGQGLSVLDNGNVGIGTTSPGISLEVVGGGRVQVASTTASGQTVNAAPTATTITMPASSASGYTGTVQHVTLPGIAYANTSNTGTATLTGLRLSQGNIDTGNQTGTSPMTVTALDISGANNTNRSGLYTWKGVKLTTPSLQDQTSHSPTANDVRALDVTLGTVDGTSAALQTGLYITGGTQTTGTQRGIYVSMAAAAHQALYVNQGISYFGGNVGIGTTVPSATLSIQGNVGIGYTGANQAIPSNGLAVFGNLGIGTTTANSNLSVAGSAHIGSLYQGTAAPINGLFVDGNVGIGATTSSNKLDVWGNTRLAGTLTVDSNSTIGGTLGVTGAATFSSTGSFSSTLSLADGSATTPALNFTNSTGSGLWYNNVTNQISLTTAGLPFNGLNINSSGNVGIGTTNASSALNVIGNVGIGTSAAGAALQVNGGGLFGWGTASVVGPSNGLGVNGNIGIGTTTTSNALQVIGSTVLGFAPSAAGPSNGLAVQGNVGIGTTSPSTALQVIGTATVTTLNATSAIQLNGTSINTGGTLSNVAYLDSANVFSANQNLNLGFDVDDAFVVADGGALTTSQTVTLSGTNNALRFTGTTPSISTSNGSFSLFPSTGNVGIGTSSVGGSLIVASGNVGIGFTSPSANLHIVNTAAQDSFRVDDVANDSSPFVIDQAGNVGIGATTAAYNLDVWGTARITGNLTLTGTTTSSGVFLAPDGTATAPAYSFSGDTNTGLWRIGADQIALTTAGGSHSGLAINSSGNVGIGNTSASQIFQVNAGSSATVITSTGNVGIGITTANSNLSVAGSAHIGALYQGTAAPANGLFVDGNVGIGATTSSNLLDVWGNSRITGTLTVDSNTTIGGTLGVTGVTTLSANNGALSFTGTTPSITSGSSLFGIFAGGNVGIGVTSPLPAVLTVRGLGTSTGLTLLTTDSSGTQRFAITDAGNVGIGHTAPGGSLVVASGNVGIGFTSPSANLHVVNTAAQNSFRVDDVANDTSPFIIDQNGNVGIGTATPAVQLDISAAAVRVAGTLPSAQAQQMLQLGATYPDRTGNTYGLLMNPTIGSVTGAFYANIDISVAVAANKTVATAYGLYIEQPTINSGAAITTNYGLRIDTQKPTGVTTSYGIYQASVNDQNYFAGNVGIGFSSPTSLLQVSSTASQDLFRVDDNGAGDTSPFVINLDGNVGIANSAPSYTLDVIGTLRTSGQTVLAASSGNVGIGTASPSNPLHVLSTTTPQFRVAYDASNYFTQAVSNAGAVTFDATGASAGFTFSDAVTASSTLTSQGAVTIDADGTESLLVRKDGDPTDGDVFTIDTTNKVVRIGESFTNSSTGTTLTAYGDTTVKGKIDTESISNITDIFVYDTTKDSDGGKWTNDERVKASSWYNETIDATGAGCTIDTNDRCGRKEFPEKAIIIATTTKLYIFDAKDNTLWMDFRKGATTTEQMIGPTDNSTGSSVFALNGKVYYGNNGTTGQLYAIDFKADRAYRYNATDDYIGIQSIANRNTTVTWLTGPSSPIVNAVINDVHARAVNGDSFVVVGTDAGMSVINETDNAVYDYDDEATAADEDYNSVWLDREGNLWALNETAQQLEKWNLVINDTADENPGNPNSTWDETTTPALFATAQTINVAPGALYVTDGTSVVDGKSQTVYVGHNGGLTVVNTKVGDETNGSVKYYSNSYITEEMPGDIRAMYTLNGSGSVGVDTLITDSDKSVKAKDLTTSGASNNPSYATGVRGTGISLDGSDFLCSGTVAGTCADDNDFDFGSTADFSVSMWARNTAGTASRHILFAKNQTFNGVTSGYSANLASGADAGRVGFRLRDGVGTSSVDTNPADAITDSNWHHYTFVRKTNGTVLEVWIDGALKISATVTARDTDNAVSFRIGTDGDGSNPWGGSIDDVMVTAEALTASQIKQMYLIGNRALQNHTASRITGVTGADNYQRLMGNASGGTSTTNRVFAVTTDDSNQFIYAGLNDATTNTGGVTVIGVDSDSVVDLYDATANTGKDDDAGTQFASSDVVAVSLSGTPCIGYNSGTTACSNTATIGIAGTNDTTTASWMERNDASLYSTLATLTSPDQVKNNVTVNNIFRVFNTYNNLTASTGEMIETPAFQVSQLGQLTANASSILTTDAFTFTNEGLGLSFRVNDVASDTSPFVIDAGGNVGVGFTSPTANLHIVNAATQDSFRIDDVANDTSPFVVNLDGNVGIANSAPSYTLDVIGTTRFSSTVTSSGVFLGPDGTATAPAYSFSGDTNTGLWRIGADQIALTTAGGSHSGLAINSSGNVGIGNTNPTGVFQVGSSATIPPLFVSSLTGNVGIGVTGPTSKLQLVETATSVPTLHISNVSTQSYNELIRLQVQDSFGTSDQAGISFRQGTTEFGRIASIYKLDGVNRWGLLFRTYDNAVMKDTFYIHGNGNVGIGTTNPTALTHLVQTAAGNAFRVDDAANDSSPFIIDQNGNVGIGLTGSAARLSIQSADGSYSDLLLTENDATLGNKGAMLQAAASGTGGGIFNIQTHNNSGTLTSRLQINESGYTGVATLAGASATDLCSDTTTMSGYNTLASCSSSIRYKENVAPLVVDKSKVFSLQPVSFKWKNRDEWDVGLIAEDTAQIIPELATYKDGQIEGVKYKLLSVYLLDILREHDQRLSQFADLRVDSDGTLVIPKAKIDTLLLQNFGLGNLQAGGSSLTTSSESEYFNVAEKVKSLDSLALVHEEKLASLESKLATTSTQVASQSAKLASASAELASASALIASQSADLADIKSRLTPVEALLATESAALANLTVNSEATVSGMLRAYDAEISNNFKSFGQTTLGNTTIAGTATVDGSLSLTGSSINSVALSKDGGKIGVLYIQDSALATSLDILNGKFIFTSDGKLQVSGEVLAEQFSVKQGRSGGTATILAGQLQAVIDNAYVDNNSIILITPRTTLGQSIAVVAREPGRFTVRLSQTELLDVTFDYLVVGQR